MLEYLTESCNEECRDLLSEIDAGELDNVYVIKHAGDYGKRAALPLASAVRAVVAKLANAARGRHVHHLQETTVGSAAPAE